MVSWGWVVYALLIGGIVGALIIVYVVGLNIRKCEKCALKHKENLEPLERALKRATEVYEGSRLLKLAPPPKHPWEQTKADRPTREKFQRNGRKK